MTVRTVTMLFGEQERICIKRPEDRGQLFDGHKYALRANAELLRQRITRADIVDGQLVLTVAE